MAYSATLANLRGLVTDEDHKRILNLFSRAGLSMDHHQFNEDILAKATKAILRTRDGKLRAAVPSPLGKCVFLNDVSMDELYTALHRHKELMKIYPRNGEGHEAFVDSSDTGYTVNNKPVEMDLVSKEHNEKNGVINDDVTNGIKPNGHANGVQGQSTNSVSQVKSFAPGLGNGVVNSTNGYTNGHSEEHMDV